MLLPVLAGTKRACQVGEKELSARVYARYVTSDILWGSKVTNFPRYLYTRQLACEPQTGSVACLSVAVRNGTKKRPVLSIEGLHPETCRLLLLIYSAFMQGQTMPKTHGNLNKGASGSMKLI